MSAGRSENLSQAGAQAEPQQSKPGIVDRMVQERAPQLNSPKLHWRAARWMLNKALGYETAIELARKVERQTGRETLDMMSAHLNLRTEISGADNIPATGPVILIANHPTGMADGIALYDALKAKRPDLKIMINIDALRITPKATDVMIPVALDVKSGGQARQDRAALVETQQHLRAGGMLIIFPSGRLSHFTWRGLQERRWRSTFLKLAERNNAPLLPVQIRARNSWKFYAGSLISNQLRDVMIFSELLNKTGARFGLSFGPVINPETLKCEAPEEVAAALHTHCTQGDLSAPFRF